MTLEEFDRLLLTHGGDPGRWPESGRAAAEALLARDPAAQALLAEARRLDRAVTAAAAATAAGSSLANRIAAALDRDAVQERGLTLGRLLAWSGSAAAAALVAGFFFGQSLAGFDVSRGMLALVTGDAVEIEAVP